MEKEKEELLELLTDKSLSFGDFILASGKKSNFYFDARLTTLSAKGSYLIGTVICGLIDKYELQAKYLGGLSIGADPIISAVTCISYQKGKPIDGFLVRKEAKEHGRKKRIEGYIKPGSKVIIVDDVATTGGSTLSAIKAVEDEGHFVEAVFCLVDREEGALENLCRYRFIPIFSKAELFSKAGYNPMI